MTSQRMAPRLCREAVTSCTALVTKWVTSWYSLSRLALSWDVDSCALKRVAEKPDMLPGCGSIAYAEHGADQLEAANAGE